MAKPAFTGLSGRLNNLPVIIAGPILRRTMPDEVNVWVALKKASTNIMLNIRDSDSLTGLIMFSGKGETLALGKNLHLACVSAKKGTGQQPLQAGKIYFYDLSIDGLDFTKSGVLLANGAGFVANFCLGNYKLPSFCLPTKQILNPRLAHGSCRKIHAKRLDGLIKLDYLLDFYHNKPLERPQLFCLTGDQIYADDVDETLLYFLIDACGVLLPDWKENLPGEVTYDKADPDKKLSVNQFYSYCTLPGWRDKIAENIGFTGGADASKNHLLMLDEFCAMYLFAWSPTLWPPEATKVCTEPVAGFQKNLWTARRALANVSTYMCFDDHEITDDWFFDYNWCERALGTANPAARRIIANGMTAFALFQMWGNLGSQFFQPASYFSGIKSCFSASAAPNWALLEQKLLPKLQAHFQGGYWLDDGASGVSPWCFQLNFDDFRIIFLDTRTQRGFESKTAAPGLIHPAKIAGQLAVTGTKPLTFVVSPAPIFETEFKSFGQDLLSLGIWNKVAFAAAPTLTMLFNLKVAGRLNYDYETWKGAPAAFSKLLLALASFQKVAILSGDVHYAFSLQISFWDEQAKSKATFLQLCSSALKNTMLGGSNKEVFAGGLYDVFDSGPDKVAVGAKTNAGVVTLGNDFKANEIIWQYLQEPVGDFRTAKNRGLQKPQSAGRKGFHYLSTVQKNQIEWDEAEYVVLENNFGTLQFGTATFGHALQYMPNLNTIAVEDLTRHALSPALPNDNTKPIK